MSKEAIKGLKPEILWERFYEITRVPRPSKREGKILDHLRSLLKDLHVNFKEDKIGNILASLPATKGLEKAPTVVLQGHVDMVCEKNREKAHDFDKDPIEIKKEGGWITADGTTLGSDNGIGVAAALAVITDKDVEHGPIEILMTVDEETGLTGANNLEPGFVSGKILLNLDSEEDGAFYVGCSGGIDTVASFNIASVNIPEGKDAYELSVTGLKGGHSGLDIHRGRANGIKLLARALKQLKPAGLSLAKIEGGSKRNAIPREAEAVLFLRKEDEAKALEIISGLQDNLKNEFKTSDSGVKLELKKISSQINSAYADEFTDKLIETLLAVPHGVINMSQDIPDLVETSTNLATVTVNQGVLTIGTSQRSSIESAKTYIAQSVASVFKLAGAKVETGDGYPGWKPNLDSEILKVSKSAFNELFGKEPEIKAIHAGLECGILGDKNPGLDMISFGPTIVGAHSPDEKVEIETVGKFYNLLKVILKKIASQN